MIWIMEFCDIYELNIIGQSPWFCAHDWTMFYKLLISFRCQNNCTEGKYGMNCAFDCSCVQNNTNSCDHVNGLCNCKNNWNGKNCQDACTDSCTKTCNCTVGQGICQPSTGQCL